MDAEADILRAVLGRPDDDTPRLAFADWLEDHAADLPDPDDARARAEFVRVQVEIDRRGIDLCTFPTTRCNVNSVGRWAHAANCPLGAMLARERALMNGHRPDWYPLPAGWFVSTGDQEARIRDYPDRPWAFVRRGFIDSATCTAAEWRAQAGALLAAHPIRRVRLTTPPDPADQLHHLCTTFDDPLAESPRVLDRWHSPPLWPGVKFDLPPGSPNHTWTDAAAGILAAGTGGPTG